MINLSHPLGTTLWVSRRYSSESRETSSRHTGQRKIFDSLNMSKSKSPCPEHKLFVDFCDNPRDSDIRTIQGSHRYISLAMRDEIPKPKKAVLQTLFQEFSIEPIKNWVFNRMSKHMLLELALCLLQDIISKGPSRAKSIQLVAATTSDGEKTVVIDDDEGRDK